MYLKHYKYCIRTTLSLLVNDPEKYAKKLQTNIPKTYQNQLKVNTGSYQNESPKKEHKNISKNIKNISKNTIFYVKLYKKYHETAPESS